jgi:hypothetical protein
MAFIRVHRLTTGLVANGSSKEDTWKSDAKYVLREVQITPRGNSIMTNVQFYADIDGVPFFRPDIPADLLDPLNQLRLVLGLPFAKGSSFNYKLTNNSGAAETYDISLILETEAWPPA